MDDPFKAGRPNGIMSHWSVCLPPSEVGSAADLPNTPGTSIITCTSDTCTSLNGSSKWHHVPLEPLPSQSEVGSDADLPNTRGTSCIMHQDASMITCTTDTCTSGPTWLPVNDWRELIFYMLQSQEKIHINVFIEPCLTTMHQESASGPPQPAKDKLVICQLSD